MNIEELKEYEILQKLKASRTRYLSKQEYLRYRELSDKFFNEVNIETINVKHHENQTTEICKLNKEAMNIYTKKA